VIHHNVTMNHKRAVRVGRIFIGHGIQSIGNEAVLTGLIIDFEDET